MMPGLPNASQPFLEHDGGVSSWAAGPVLGFHAGYCDSSSSFCVSIVLRSFLNELKHYLDL